MSSAWMQEYMLALEVRDTLEKANETATNAYTRLADRHAELHKAVVKRSAIPHPDHQDIPGRGESPQTSRLPPSIVGSSPCSRPPSTTSLSGSQRAASPNSLAALRADLSAANHTIHTLNEQITTLQSQISKLNLQSSTFGIKSKSLRDRVTTLEADRSSLARRVRDRESELKEKARLVESVQDEMVGLEMQVNVAEERNQNLKRENGELVERWMRRVGKEAEDLNLGSGFK